MAQFTVYCDCCNFRDIVDGDPQHFGNRLYQYNTSPCPSRIPKLDREKREITSPDPIGLMPKFRCPQCGRAITAKKIRKKDQTNGQDQTIRREDGTVGPEIP